MCIGHYQQSENISSNIFTLLIVSDAHKEYILCASDTINRVKILEEIFLNHILDKKLKSRIYEELLQLKNNTNKTKNNWVEK